MKRILTFSDSLPSNYKCFLTKMFEHFCIFCYTVDCFGGKPRKFIPEQPICIFSCVTITMTPVYIDAKHTCKHCYSIVCLLNLN